MCCYSSSCSCCCYERFLTAFLFVGPLATHPTGSWCHFYMAEFIMDNNKNCRKLLPTTRRRERERDVRQVRLASCPLILQSYRNCAHLHHMVNGTSFPRKMAYISRPARPVWYGTARLGLPFCQATVKLSCFASNPLLLIFN